MNDGSFRSVSSLRSLHTLSRAVLRWVRENRLLTAALGLMGLAAWGLDRRLPFLNGPPEWRWIYGNNTFYFWPTWLKALPFLAAGALAIGTLCRWAGRRAAALAGLVAFGFYLHFIGYWLATPGGINHWGRIIVDAKTTSYYTAAQWIRDGRLPPLGETLRRYPDLLAELPLHASTHPPGAVLACLAVQRVAAAWPTATDRLGRVYEGLGMNHEGYRFPTSRTDAVAATTLAILIILFALLGAVPLWALIREARWGVPPSGGISPHAEAVAWGAAALWVTYPALMIFEPQFDQVYPTIVLACLWAAQRGLRARPLAWGAVAGTLFMVGIALNFVLLFVAPMLLAMAWLEKEFRIQNPEFRIQNPEFRIQNSEENSFPFRPLGPFRPFRLAAGAVAACLIIEALLRWGFGIRLFEIFMAAVRLQRDVHLPGVKRHYHVWLFYNIYDFLFFAGIPLAILALAWAVRVERGFRRAWTLTAPAWLVFPLAAAVLDISGLTPAETSRIWLFLAPGVAWAGAAELVRRAGAGWRSSLGVLLVAQMMFYFLCRAKLTFIGW